MKKIALIIITVIALNFIGVLLPQNVQAVGVESPDKTFSVKQNLKLGDSDQSAKYFEGGGSPIVKAITMIIDYATKIIGSIAVILVIAAGFMMMVSQGNQQKIDEAKDIFKYAIIGLAVVFLSYIITIFVQSIFTSAQ